jgi:hopanoid biosynthesis associated protein HpnK
MVASPGAADAVKRARSFPRLRVGLHVVLVEARPTLPPKHIPDLVGHDGCFRTDMARLGFDIAVRPAVRRQVAAEITAQFEAYRSFGLALDHVNAHKHFHLHPVIGAQIIAIGRRFGARAIRVPSEPAAVLAAVAPETPVFTSRLVAQWARILRRQARRAGMIVPDAVFGLAWSGAMTRERLNGLLDRLPTGVIEIYTHPATADRFSGQAAGYRYTEELAALTDPAAIEAVRRSGRQLGGFSDV